MDELDHNDGLDTPEMGKKEVTFAPEMDVKELEGKFDSSKNIDRVSRLTDVNLGMNGENDPDEGNKDEEADEEKKKEKQQIEKLSKPFWFTKAVAKRPVFFLLFRIFTMLTISLIVYFTGAGDLSSGYYIIYTKISDSFLECQTVQ